MEQSRSRSPWGINSPGTLRSKAVLGRASSCWDGAWPQPTWQEETWPGAGNAMVPERWKRLVFCFFILGVGACPALAADQAVLRPRVPADKIDEAKAWANPVPATADNIEKGKALFQGKAFLCDLPWQGREGAGRHRRAAREIAEKFYRQSMANCEKRWRTILDPEEWKSRNRYGLLRSARADGRRGVAGALVCALVRPLMRSV